MGKFTDVQEDIFSIFDSVSWKAESIPTFPVNFVVEKATEYIRVSIIPSGQGINRVSTSGLLMIDIFSAAGRGPARSTYIADKLDSYLVANSVKTNNGVTQFSNSSLTPRGQDKDNPALYRAEYSIPFNYFLGV